MKKVADLTLLDNAITYLQQLISRPAAMFDQRASLTALEKVVNVAREKGDACAARFTVVLTQCWALCGSSALQPILTKLVATKEEAEITKDVEKALKHARPPAHSVFLWSSLSGLHLSKGSFG